MTEHALALLFVLYTNTYKLPTGLVSALCWAESAHQTQVYNAELDGHKSLGVCEIKLDTARMMGFHGTEKQLLNPKMNIKYAAKYLKWQIERYDGDVYKGIAAYNSGTYREDKRHRPKNRRYVARVLRAWSKRR